MKQIGIFIAAIAFTACSNPRAESETKSMMQDTAPGVSATESPVANRPLRERSAMSVPSTGGRVAMTTDGKWRVFKTNGIPDHPTGQFPTRGNPNAIRSQNITMRVPLDPVKSDTPQPVRGAIGIAVNGVQYRPTTAGFWDPNARRGHSMEGDRNWSLDIFGAPGHLGLDFNNAHVGPNGLYHYHGIANSLTETSGSSLVGYAGDGFEIHYIGGEAVSGYRLKEGTRPSGPGGKYDGTYNEDYEYVGGDGVLDECNGGMLDGKYVYFITESYPYVGRCLWGSTSPDFAGGEH